jgi:hypothetical protein
LSENLTNRLSFVKKHGTSFKKDTLKHEDVNVPLALGGNATTAVFYLEAQILSLLLDESIMQQDNFANGYDIFTGEPLVPIYIMEKYYC